jgi:hypothetical protein
VVECGALEKRCASDWRTGSSNLPPSVSTPAARHEKYAAERPELASWLSPERSRARRDIPGACCGRLARAGPQRMAPCDALGDGDELQLGCLLWLVLESDDQVRPERLRQPS